MIEQLFFTLSSSSSSIQNSLIYKYMSAVSYAGISVILSSFSPADIPKRLYSTFREGNFLVSILFLSDQVAMKAIT